MCGCSGGTTGSDLPAFISSRHEKWEWGAGGVTGSTRPAKLFDTQVADGELQRHSESQQVARGLASVVAELLMVPMAKHPCACVSGRKRDREPSAHAARHQHQTDDWVMRPLTAAQVTYAGGDVAHLHALRCLQHERLGTDGVAKVLAVGYAHHMHSPSGCVMFQ